MTHPNLEKLIEQGFIRSDYMVGNLPIYKKGQMYCAYDRTTDTVMQKYLVSAIPIKPKDTEKV